MPAFLLPGELIVDSFAGGGGASLGIELALGRSPDIAINHDAEACALHAANHPSSRHFRENVWKVDPREACGGRPVGLMWLSPDCKHFSKAKGGKPVSRRVRGLAWVAVRWAAAVRPRVIVLENVEEFQTWGPLGVDGRPCPERRGATFRRFIRGLEKLGYDVQWRELRAADYGAPTSRKRLFLIARCDGQPIVWPTPTHGKGRPLAWRTAAECIEWSIPCPSIFLTKEEARSLGVKRPLAEATLRRIGRGVRRYVIEAAQPFIVGLGGRMGQSPERGVDRPYQTITAQDHHAVVASHLVKLRGTSQVGQPIDEPAPTITAGGWHLAEVRAFLVAYYGNEKEGGSLFDPMRTVTSKDRLGLVTVHGIDSAIADIGMRMLAPRELYRAQGFPDSYRIDIEYNGKPMTKTAQVRMCGNSVCPPLARALVAANLTADVPLALDAA